MAASGTKKIMLSKKNIDGYNSVRKTENKSLLCHAPFTNLNFEQNGNVTACCFNRKEVLGKYPEQTIAEIWKGAALKDFRNKIRSNDLGGGCKLCRILLESENYNGTKAIHYDEYASGEKPFDKLKTAIGFEPQYYPKVFEFEISNTCNLACEMCSGYFSSTIRQKREMLPPLPNPYDDDFVRQVASFMPYLTDLKFLGGEPFLIEIYLKIWEQVIAVNPNIRIHITTNGSVYNQRIEALLENLKAGFVFSIDSSNSERYDQIRLGAKYERVLENFARFKKIAAQKNTYLSIASCVMSNNWMDLPDLVRFANAEGVSIHFNIVWNPGHLSIRFMHYHEIENIIRFLQAAKLPEETEREKSNLNNYLEIINTLEYWKKERSYTRLVDDISEAYVFNADALNAIPADPLSQKIAHAVLFHFFQAKKENEKIFLLEKFFGYAIPETTDVGKLLLDIWRVAGDTPFATALLNLYVPLYSVLLGEKELDEFVAKMETGKPMMLNFKHLQALLSDMVDGIARQGILQQLLLVKNNSSATHQQHLEESY